LDSEKAFDDLLEAFPFSGYIKSSLLDGVYKTVADTAINNLSPGSSILDFGCGPCDKIGVLSFLGFNCSACDDLQDDWHQKENNLQKILNFSKSLNIEFYKSDGQSIPNINETFDMIMLNDVIEHLHNSPRSLLLSLLDKLNDNGILLITVPNAGNIRKRLALLFGKTNMPNFSEYYWSGDPWRGHVREYVYNDLKQLSEFLNLTIIILKGKNHMLEKVPGILLPLYKIITSIFTDWRDSWLLVAQKKTVN